jgi:hypothetical protein
MKCVSCKKKKAISYEEIGLGRYCQDCLDRENEIWENESGCINYSDSEEESKKIKNDE